MPYYVVVFNIHGNMGVTQGATEVWVGSKMAEMYDMCIHVFAIPVFALTSKRTL